LIKFPSPEIIIVRSGKETSGEEYGFLKVKFMGAARAVTGSCCILETNGHRFAVDCGMPQGMGEIGAAVARREARPFRVRSWEGKEGTFGAIFCARMAIGIVGASRETRDRAPKGRSK